MSNEILVALVAAGVSVISVLVSLYGQIRTTRLAHQLDKQKETRSAEAQSRILISKYRDPLLSSALDLKGRLFNIVRLGFFGIYYKSERNKDYSINNTLYVIAEFFCWIEILRQEIQFLDLGSIDSNRNLVNLLNNIKHSFATSDSDSVFQVLRGEQRAIGEIMIKRSDDSNRASCIGFADFSSKLSGKGFSKWFEKLCEDIEIIAKNPGERSERLVVVHNNLLDLIDFLDPDHIRIPDKFRDYL